MIYESYNMMFYEKRILSTCPLSPIGSLRIILWTVHFHPLDHSTPGPYNCRRTVHFLKDRPLSVNRPSTLTRDRPLSDRPSTFDGPSTFGTVHFPPDSYQPHSLPHAHIPGFGGRKLWTIAIVSVLQ